MRVEDRNRMQIDRKCRFVRARPKRVKDSYLNCGTINIDGEGLFALTMGSSNQASALAFSAAFHQGGCPFTIGANIRSPVRSKSFFMPQFSRCPASQRNPENAAKVRL